MNTAAEELQEVYKKDLASLAGLLGDYLNKNFHFNEKQPLHLSGLLPQVRKLEGVWTSETEDSLRGLIRAYGSLNSVLIELSKKHADIFPYRLVRHPTSPGTVGLVPLSSSFSYGGEGRRKPTPTSTDLARKGRKPSVPKAAPAVVNSSELLQTFMKDVSDTLKEILEIMKKRV